MAIRICRRQVAPLWALCLRVGVPPRFHFGWLAVISGWIHTLVLSLGELWWGVVPVASHSASCLGAHVGVDPFPVGDCLKWWLPA